jgi:hypothetical protein
VQLSSFVRTMTNEGQPRLSAMGGDSARDAEDTSPNNLDTGMDGILSPNFWLQFQRRTRAGALQQIFFLSRAPMRLQ